MLLRDAKGEHTEDAALQRAQRLRQDLGSLPWVRQCAVTVMMAHLRVVVGLFSAAAAAAGGALPAPERDLAPVGGLHAGLEDGQLWDVAIGRRPYITETTGELLLQASPAILGKTLTITAELPCSLSSIVAALCHTVARMCRCPLHARMPLPT